MDTELGDAAIGKHVELRSSFLPNPEPARRGKETG
jgi:hypothetical protein